MPLPLADINQAMKETSSSHEKLLQIIREIELCIFRNASAGLPSPPSPTPAYHHPEPPLAAVGNENTETDYTDGSSDGGDLEATEGILDDPNWAWSISGEGVSPVYVPPSQEQV